MATRGAAMIRSILKSLLKPEAYPEPTTKVELVQTHVSWIFLTDAHAYKIKKPVDFGFLNFSTIDRRRFYCNEEVKFNSRLCQGIYEGVVELRESAGSASFQGDGPVIDYAVKMKRLPAERMLDRMIAENTVQASELIDVARVIAEFHRTAPTSPSVAEYGHLDRILFNWQENFDQTTPFENSTLPASERELIRTWVSTYAANHSETFSQRVADGFIRECDGDIHLENICLVNGSVFIFDCIEFNERFRCCDTAADVAFLLMDLDYHGRHDLSEEVITAYLDASGDTGMMELVAFYKVYRAFVRGKIESFHMRDADIDPREQSLSKAKAVRYFRLARGYIERSTFQTTIFITCGLMGSGKSTLADQLSFELGIALFTSDMIRKQSADIAPDTACSAAFGEGLYSQQNNDDTYDELIRLAKEQLAVRRSVIIDAAFLHKKDRLRCADLAEHSAARFIIIFVSCGEPENRRRLVERSTSGRAISDGRSELLNSQRQIFEPPTEERGVVISIQSTAPPSTLCNLIYERLG
jgi:uncharacterized protein